MYKSHDKQEIGHEWVIQTLEERNASLLANFQVQNIIVNIQNPCYNYCYRDFVVMSLVQLLYQWHHHIGSSKRKINAPFALTHLPSEIFPFFYFAGHQGQWWAGMFFKVVLLRVAKKIFCIFPSTCMFDWIALDLFPLHKLEGASKLFMTIKTDWWITSGTRKNDVAVHGQLRAEVCMNLPALKLFPTWIALNCLCRSTSHFTSITCGIISFDHQEPYFVIQLDL